MGIVFYSFKMRFCVFCFFDLIKFFFDEQICKLIFGLWIYDNFNINLMYFVFGEKGLDIVDLRVNREWSVIESLVMRLDKEFQYVINKYLLIEFFFLVIEEFYILLLCVYFVGSFIGDFSFVLVFIVF